VRIEPVRPICERNIEYKPILVKFKHVEEAVRGLPLWLRVRLILKIDCRVIHPAPIDRALIGGGRMQWGLLGPERLAGSRRTRPLGLGAAVRKFNQLAVPGLGGVWFAKQLFLATLGVIVADRLRQMNRNVKTIETANAVEALACWLRLREQRLAEGHPIARRPKTSRQGQI